MTNERDILIIGAFLLSKPMKGGEIETALNFKSKWEGLQRNFSYLKGSFHEDSDDKGREARKRRYPKDDLSDLNRGPGI